MKTPVVFIIFNRPKETKQVFEAIRNARPQKLFIIADGARRESEKTLCEETRNVVSDIDWQCEVVREYSDVNLGCKRRISSGLDFVFKLTERAIILEDDCLPHPSFFRFCEELLEYYKDDKDVVHISGNFFQQKNKKFINDASYHFSKISHIWGWATWRRAWQTYDVQIKDWPELKAKSALKPPFQNIGAYEYWSGIWDKYYENKIDSWDGQWFYNCFKHGLSINPNVNLVTNIGFGAEATHTKSQSDSSNIPFQEIKFPLIHPKEKTINQNYEDFIWRQNFGIDKKIIYRILRPIKNMFPEQYQKIKKLLGKK